MESIHLLFVIATGLIFGSFITLASHRLPRAEEIIFQPSHCPACNATLRARDLWPVLSWLAERGRCRHCHASIHWRYPLIELCTALLFVMIYWQYGWTEKTLILSLAAVTLLTMIVVDLEHYIIPDLVHCVLLPLGVWWNISALTDAGWGLLLGLALGLALRYGYRWLRHKDGLGLGDVKFLAVAGVWLGPELLVPFLFFSGILGMGTALAWRLLGHGRKFPFGPALAASLFICVAYPAAPQAFWHMQMWVHR